MSQYKHFSYFVLFSILQNSPHLLPLSEHLLRGGYLTIRLRYPKYTTEGI
jgi:hypothetical protein